MRVSQTRATPRNALFITRIEQVRGSSPGLAAPKTVVTSLVNLHDDQAACGGMLYTNFTPTRMNNWKHLAIQSRRICLG